MSLEVMKKLLDAVRFLGTLEYFTKWILLCTSFSKSFHAMVGRHNERLLTLIEGKGSF